MPCGPQWVTMYVTRRCNLKWPWRSCQLPDAPGPRGSSDAVPWDFPPALFRRICRQIRDAGTRMVILTGEGEPTLHPALT